MCHSQTKIRGKSKLFVKRSRTKQATIEDKKGKCNQRKSARGNNYYKAPTYRNNTG